MVSVRGIISGKSNTTHIASRRQNANTYNQAKGQRTAAQANERRKANSTNIPTRIGRYPPNQRPRDDTDYARFF